MVDGGDRRDNCEAEPEAITPGAVLRSLERLEEDAEGGRGDDGAGVRDDQGDLSIRSGRGELRGRHRGVVSNGVVDEVRDEALQDHPIAGCHGGLQRDVQPPVARIGGVQDIHLAPDPQRRGGDERGGVADLQG